MRRRSWLVWAGIIIVRSTALAAPPPTADGGKPFDLGGLGGGNRKDPITITSDSLEFDYKTNVVTYRGNVLAVQADVKVKSDVLVIVFAGKPVVVAKPGAKPDTNAAPPSETNATPSPGAGGKVTLQSVTASGNVRIDQAARWATGGKAVFDQSTRTFVLSEKPFLHEGQNEVSGVRIVVYLDENRSVVEGGPAKRVQAVLYPDKGGGLAPERPAATTH